MKKVVIILAAVFLMSAYANAATPPKEVVSAFKANFPSAIHVKWGKENSKEWEAEFESNGKKLSANFLEDGSWVETEQEINYSELPVAVSAAISKLYTGWKVTEADRTDTSKHGLIYEVDLKSGLQKKEVAFKEDGTLVVE